MSRVLAVDDKEENLYYLRVLLTGHGHQVVTARHGAEALVRARQSPPDVVVSDLLMPVMDGYTLLRHWKADARLRHLPFLVYTATYTEPEDERLALSLGADAFVLKPAEPEVFLARLREVLAAAAAPAPTAPPVPLEDEQAQLRVYSTALIRKLEEKTLQLEEANAALQHDIGERMAVEAALRASEAKFRLLAENVDEVFWISDPTRSQMHYVSPAYERIWGRTCESLHKAPRTWLEAVHPDDRARVAQAAFERQGLDEHEETYRIVRPDGTIRWIRDRAFPVLGDHDGDARVVGTAEDVTVRRDLEEQIRQAQKLEAIGTLAGGIAHDFNNILSAVIGYTELAQTRIQGDPTSSGYLAAVLRGCSRAVDLVRQILAFSRQQEGQRRPVELRPIVAEPLQLLRATIPSTIAFDLALDHDLPLVLADVTQVHQIVMNLCTNAAHAMRGHPGRLTVRLERVGVDAALASHTHGLRPGPYVRLTVADTGHGMDEATLGRIFEPFFTTKGPGEGTGLGLAVVHGIVEDHGGAIHVDSRPGAGTAFCVYFPEHVSEAPAAPPPPARPTTIPRGHGERILFVDDEPQIASLGGEILKALGYVSTSFTDPEEALAAMRAAPDAYDLVITDLTMPGMTGVELVRRLRKAKRSLPVILATGFNTSLTPEGMTAEAIEGLLSKPFTVQDLAQAVDRALHAPGAP